MYKYTDQALTKVELVLVATEFNKERYPDTAAIKAHLRGCTYTNQLFDPEDEDIRVESDNAIGFQHQRLCCGYQKDIRVKTCDNNHVLVYALTSKEADNKLKQVHTKWLSKL